MPGRWLEKQSLDTFSRSAGEDAKPLGFAPATTTGELLNVANKSGAEVVVLSLTQRVYFQRRWWHPLLDALNGDGVALALPMGPSLPPSQGLALGYWTPSDLEELAGTFYSERREITGDFFTLLGAFPEGILAQVDPQLPLVELLKAISGMGKTVAAGGLVHLFSDFYSSPRQDMLHLVTTVPKRVLDVGCAKGEFGRLLKERWGCEVWGIEIVEESAKIAAGVLDRVEVMDVEEASPSWNGMFDLVVLGDILEHLRDPWGFLRKVRGWMVPGGSVVTSIPNTGFYPIVRALLQGRFDYVPVGLLCVEHLRFFTGNTLKEMFEESGFRVEIIEPQPATLPEPYLRELHELARVIPGIDTECLESPGYYVVATAKD